MDYVNYNNSNVEIKFDSYVDNTLENDSSYTPSYKDNFSIPRNLSDCKININHITYRFKKDTFIGLSPALTLVSLGVIPYYDAMGFKTIVSVKTKSGEVSKEIDSGIIEYKFGLYYLPEYLKARFDKNKMVSGNITAEMYKKQI